MWGVNVHTNARTRAYDFIYVKIDSRACTFFCDLFDDAIVLLSRLDEFADELFHHCTHTPESREREGRSNFFNEIEMSISVRFFFAFRLANVCR